jgi:hypothetical protein
MTKRIYFKTLPLSRIFGLCGSRVIRDPDEISLRNEKRSLDLRER